MKSVQPRRESSSQRWLLVAFAGTRTSADIHQREKREILAAGYGQERIRGPCCRRVPMYFCTAPNDAIAAQSEARPMHLVFHTQPADEHSSEARDHYVRNVTVAVAVFNNAVEQKLRNLLDAIEESGRSLPRRINDAFAVDRVRDASNVMNKAC